jgi:thiol-disulfide isomerase/thioredoxin
VARGATTARRTLRIRVLLTAAVLLCAAAAGVAAYLLTAASSPRASTSATAWRLPRLTGTGTVALADFRGKPVVVNFFASWCTPCRSELPIFHDISQRLGGGVAFVGVDSEENGDGLALARQTGITSWPLARDVGGSQMSGLREAVEATPGMPVTAFYDRNGMLRDARLGAMSSDALAAELQQLFAVSVP